MVSSSFSQEITLTSKAQVSVLTCGAGSDLYTTFGHTAFRIQDLSLGIDHVFNYGTFNFNPPGFYVDFAKGKLIYKLSGQKLPNFLYTYQLENRWVKEQILALSLAEKQKLFEYLQHNNLPQNKDYAYDFFYDNCATKIRDVLKEVLGKELVFHEDYLDEQFTFRELIHQNLHPNSWSAFGIDLALGSVIDKTASVEDHMFLPNYVNEQLMHTTLKTKPLIERERTILDIKRPTAPPYFLSSPLFWFILLLLFVLIITIIDFKNEVRSRWLDFFLFFTTGLIGFVLIFLWFFTNHTATAGNFNILWAFPPNLIISFYMIRSTPLPEWIYNYFPIALGLMMITLLLWITEIQVFSPVLLPLLVALGLRYLFLFKKHQGLFSLRRFLKKYNTQQT